MKKLTLLLLLFISFNCSYAIHNDTTDTNQGGVVDRFGNYYNFDEIMIPLQTGKTVSLTANCGRFTIFYDSNSGMGGNSQTEIERRAVVEAVFNDLSNFLNPGPGSGNPAQVNILIGDLTQFTVPVGALAGASPYFCSPAGTLGGIGDNEVWKTLISGTDSYTSTGAPMNPSFNGGAYHGFMIFNFTGVNWFYTLNSTVGIGSNTDFYTVVLHEAMHLLGFESEISSNGQSVQGVNRPFYSRYDLRLQTSAGVPLLATSSAFPIYNNYFNASSNNLISSTGCAGACIYNGSVNRNIYTPIPFENGSSLSHFEDACSPYFNDDGVYLMSNFNPPSKVQRWPQTEERSVLCDLGYMVNGTFGDASHVSFHDYLTSSCNQYSSTNFSQQVVGINDGIANFTYTYVVTMNQSITINPLTNDYIPSGNLGIEGQEVLIGNGILTPTSTGFIYQTNQASIGLNLIRYIPFDATTQVRGNITYVYIWVKDNSCNANTCTMLNNGNFENITNCGDVTDYGGLSCWYNCWNSSDFYKRSCTSNGGSYNIPTFTYTTPGTDTYSGSQLNNDCFMGMGSYNATHPEVMQTRLSSPLIPQSDYILTFVAKSWDKGDHQNAVDIYFAANPTMLTGLTGLYWINPPLPQLVPYASTTVPHDGQWWSRSIPFTFSGNNVSDYLILGNNTTNSPIGSGSYLFIDDISIQPDNGIDLNLPTSVCQNTTIPDLENFVTPTGGVFSGNGVSLVNGHYQFQPTSLNNHIIKYTITDSYGCESFLYATITINPTPTVSLNVTNASCDACIGQVASQVSGGTPPYTYLWNTVPPRTTSSIDFLCPGNYQVEVTDNNGCTASNSGTVTDLISSQWPWIMDNQSGQQIIYDIVYDGDQYIYALATLTGECDLFGIPIEFPQNYKYIFVFKYDYCGNPVNFSLVGYDMQLVKEGINVRYLIDKINLPNGAQKIVITGKFDWLYGYGNNDINGSNDIFIEFLDPATLTAISPDDIIHIYGDQMIPCSIDCDLDLALGLSTDGTSAYVSGYYAGNILSFSQNGNVTTPIIGNPDISKLDMFMTRYDYSTITNSPNMIWARNNYSSVYNDIGFNMKVKNGFLYYTSNHAGYSYLWRLNPANGVNTAGSPQLVGYPECYFITDMDAGPLNELYLCGYKQINSTSTSSRKAFVCKYPNPASSILWSSVTNKINQNFGSIYNTASKLSVDQTFGNVYVAGTFGENNFTFGGANAILLYQGNTNNHFAAKFNNNLTTQWQTGLGNFSGSGNSGANTFVYDNYHNKFYLGGSYTNTLYLNQQGAFDDGTPGQGTLNAFIARFEDLGEAWYKDYEINNDDNFNSSMSNSNITVFPNPGKGYFNIHTENNESIVIIEVADMLGRIVYSKNDVNENPDFVLDLTNLAANSYLLTITTDNSVYINKIVIIN